MLTLQNNNIYLRALEPEDFLFLSEIENDENLWLLGSVVQPFSDFVLKEYLKNATEDIYKVGQLRLVICMKNGLPVGLIDLFDFEPKHRRAGLGIVILQAYRGKGVGREALECVENYAKKHLGLHQLYAHILEGNTASIRLFKKCGFEQSGVKKDWIYHNRDYHNECLFQKIL